MPTLEQLGLKPGDPFQYQSPGGLTVLGTIHRIDEEKGHVESFVEWSSSHSPIGELFPEGKFQTNKEDPGFSKLPKPDNSNPIFP